MQSSVLLVHFCDWHIVHMFCNSSVAMNTSLRSSSLHATLCLVQALHRIVHFKNWKQIYS